MMPNFIELNADKLAPPKGAAAKRDGRTNKGFGLGIFGFRCAKCGHYHSTTGGSRFVMIGGRRRRVGPGCAQGGACA